MKIVIPGGSGLVAPRALAEPRRDGHEVVVLSRSPRHSGVVRSVHWDGANLGTWVDELERADVVINLAGRSVNCRYNARNRREIMGSRIDSTRVLAQAISDSANPRRPGCTQARPRSTPIATTRRTTSAQASSAAASRACRRHGGSSIDVAQAWERELEAAETPHTRKVAMRTAMVMSPDRESVFDAAGLVRRGRTAGSAPAQRSPGCTMRIALGGRCGG